VAETISSLLPEGGQPPDLLDRLPPQGLVERSSVFFRQEMSIQDRLWLGGQNILGLGPETDGVLAPYDGEDGTARLLLIEYPTSQAAADGLTNLEQLSPNDLVVADVNEELLGAVFGTMSESTALSLLQDVLAEE
jgi:hypothetical protein